MQVTSLLSRQEHDHDHGHHLHHHDHEHGPDCGCGHDHEHSTVHLWQAILGAVFVLNAFVIEWFFEQGHAMASVSGCLGAIILGYPIVVTAIKDLRKGRLTINELVAIAVLAAFASGANPEEPFSQIASAGYKTAGIVAFLMLVGE